MTIISGKAMIAESNHPQVWCLHMDTTDYGSLEAVWHDHMLLVADLDVEVFSKDHFIRLGRYDSLYLT
jgi:hypothetical protein